MGGVAGEVLWGVDSGASPCGEWGPGSPPYSSLPGRLASSSAIFLCWSPTPSQKSHFKKYGPKLSSIAFHPLLITGSIITAFQLSLLSLSIKSSKQLLRLGTKMKQNNKEQTVQFQCFSYFHLVLVQQWLITHNLGNLMVAHSPSPPVFTKAACGAHVKNPTLRGSQNRTVSA